MKLLTYIFLHLPTPNKHAIIKLIIYSQVNALKTRLTPITDNTSKKISILATKKEEGKSISIRITSQFSHKKLQTLRGQNAQKVKYYDGIHLPKSYKSSLIFKVQTFEEIQNL